MAPRDLRPERPSAARGRDAVGTARPRRRNPLYAEQYVRMLAERGSAQDSPLPDSVQGIIAARLDSLPAEEKALLRRKVGGCGPAGALG
jgi:hypothetical protein